MISHLGEGIGRRAIGRALLRPGAVRPVGECDIRPALAVHVRDAICEVVSEDAIVRLACRALPVCQQIAVGIIGESDTVQRQRRMRMGG